MHVLTLIAGEGCKPVVFEIPEDKDPGAIMQRAIQEVDRLANSRRPSNPEPRQPR